jgi:DNA-binding MarR family transcriptional regulator
MRRAFFIQKIMNYFSLSNNTLRKELKLTVNQMAILCYLYEARPFNDDEKWHKESNEVVSDYLDIPLIEYTSDIDMLVKMEFLEYRPFSIQYAITRKTYDIAVSPFHLFKK